MADKTNAFGSLPIIFTLNPNSKGKFSQTKLNFFNNLWINPTGGTGWDPGSSTGGNPGNYYFANSGTQQQVNGTQVQLTATADSTFNASLLIPKKNPSGANPGNQLYNGNGPKYRKYSNLQAAINTWLKIKNIGTGVGQLPAAGLTSTYFTGGRFNLGTSAAAAATGSDSAPNLQAGQDAYFFVEPFIGTQDDGSKKSENFADMSYIDAFNGGVDLIPWFYNPQTNELQQSENVDLSPVNSIQATKNPAVQSNAFSGKTTASAVKWLQANIKPMGSQGSAQFPFWPKSMTPVSGSKYMRLNSPEYAKTLVYDTTQANNSLYYYHDFSNYLNQLQKQANGATTPGGAANVPWSVANKGLPWLTKSTNNGDEYGYRIYNVVFNGFTGPNPLGATIDVYCAPTTQIKAWINGTPVNNQSATKITLFWDNQASNWKKGVNVLSDPGNGIYGANPGGMLTPYDPNGIPQTPSYFGNLGKSNYYTWIVGDFLAALNYGMPLGKFPGSYTDSNNKNYTNGQYIPPQLWLTETPGALGDNMFSKKGWAFAAIQSSPNNYNQYAYGISQVAAYDYGWAFSDRMQSSIGVTPNPYTYDSAGSKTLTSAYESPNGPGGGTFSNTAPANANDTSITFSIDNSKSIQTLFNQLQKGQNLYLGGLNALPNGSKAYYVKSVNTSTGEVSLSGGSNSDGSLITGIGAKADVNFSTASSSVGYSQKYLYFHSNDLSGIQVGWTVSGQDEIPSGTTVVDVVTGIPGYTNVGYVKLSKRFTLINADKGIPWTFTDPSASSPFVFLEARVRPPAKVPTSSQGSLQRRNRFTRRASLKTKEALMRSDSSLFSPSSSTNDTQPNIVDPALGLIAGFQSPQYI